MVVESIGEIRRKTQIERVFLQKLMDYPADYIVWILLHTSITPNIVTIFRVISQFAACFILLGGNYTSLIIGTVVFQSLYVFDLVDGKLARIKNKFSINGVFIDVAGHHIVNSMFIIFFSYVLSSLYNSWLWLIVGFLTVIFMLFEKAIRINPYRLNPEWFGGDMPALESLFRKKSKTNSNIVSIFSVTIPFGFFFFGVIFGLAKWLLLFYCIIYFLYNIFILYKQINIIQKYEGGK